MFVYIYFGQRALSHSRAGFKQTYMYTIAKNFKQRALRGDERILSVVIPPEHNPLHAFCDHEDPITMALANKALVPITYPHSQPATQSHECQ